MTFQDFFNQYNGQSNVGNTTANRGQCVGLEAVWCDALGLPHIWGDACDLFVNADEKFYEKILNTPDAIPQEGDIIVWPLKFNGTAGHTGIATKNCTLANLECFEQNDPLGSNCHIKIYKGTSYTIVIGWLRPIVTVTAQSQIAQLQAQLDDMRKQRDTEHNYFGGLCDVMKVAAVFETAKSELEKLVGIEDKYNQASGQLSEAQTQVTDLKTQIQALSDSHDALVISQDALQGKLDKDTATIADLTKKLTELEAGIQQPIRKGWKQKLVSFIDSL